MAAAEIKKTMAAKEGEETSWQAAKAT